MSPGSRRLHSGKRRLWVWRLTQTPYKNLLRSFLAGGVICRLSSILIRHSNNFDFHIHALGQRGHLDGGTGGRILLEIRTINFVNDLEIAKVRKENRCLNHMIESHAFSLQNGCNVVEYAPGLPCNIAGDDLARFRVQRNLTAAK